MKADFSNTFLFNNIALEFKNIDLLLAPVFTILISLVMGILSCKLYLLQWNNWYALDNVKRPSALWCQQRCLSHLNTAGLHRKFRFIVVPPRALTIMILFSGADPDGFHRFPIELDNFQSDWLTVKMPEYSTLESLNLKVSPNEHIPAPAFGVCVFWKQFSFFDLF